MRKYQGIIMDKLRIAMTEEQEKGFAATCAKRILYQEKIFLLFIIAFQLYNIGYTLLYTRGRLHTVPSRVYVGFYMLLLLVSLGSFFLAEQWKKKFPATVAKVMRFQFLYAVFLLAWGAGITVYDQRVSENISVYLVMALSVAVLIYFTPVQSVVVYGVFLVVLFWLLPVFKDSGKDNYGEYVNLAIMTLMCVLINVYHYYMERRSYLQQQIIMEKNSHLKYLANRDTLTGLRNRRFLETEMDVLYEKYRSKKMPITFMMIDIDSFKVYNDQYGHPQGDECLRRVSWRLEKELEKDREYLIRYGGEEFLYIGFEKDEQEAERKGQYFNEIIRRLIIGPSEQEAMGITISIGSYTAVWDEAVKNGSWIDCIDKADKALYIAKDSGKDKFIAISSGDEN